MPRKKRVMEMESMEARHSQLEDVMPLGSVLLMSDIPYQVLEVGPRPAGPLSPHPAVQFIETDFDYRREQRVGTLVLSQKAWESWFTEEELYPQFQGGWLKAAEELGKSEYVTFGCPLCPLFRTRDFQQALTHAKQHGG